MPIDAEQWRAQTGLFCASRVLLRPPRCKQPKPKVQADTLSLNIQLSLAVLLVTLRTGVFYASRSLQLLWLIACRTSQLLSSIVRVGCKRLRGVSVLLALCLVVVQMLLITSGDVEENPGPPKIEAPEPSPLRVNDLRVVRAELLDVSSKWFDIGIMLGLKVSDMEIIRRENEDPVICLREMLLKWLKSTEHTTWESLACALGGDPVGESWLAEQLRAKYYYKTAQATDPSPLGENDLKDIHRELLNISSKSYDIGLELGLEVSLLERIHKDNQDVTRCLLEVLVNWLRHTMPLPTWESLAYALESRNVGESRLAEQLRAKYSKTAQATVPSLGPDDLVYVYEELLAICPMWYDIGLQLRLSPAFLETVEVQHYDSHTCLRKILLHWLKGNDPSPTWEGLVSALRSRTVEATDLAEDLKAKYCETTQAADVPQKLQTGEQLKEQEIESLQMQKDEEIAIAQWKTQLAEASITHGRQLQVLQQELQSVRTENQQLKEKIQSEEQVLENLRSEAAQQAAEASVQHEMQLKTFQQAVEGLQVQIKKKDEEFGQWKKQSSEANIKHSRELQALEQELQSVHTERQELREQLQLRDQELVSVHQESKELREQVEGAGRDIDLLQQDLKALERQLIADHEKQQNEHEMDFQKYHQSIISAFEHLHSKVHSIIQGSTPSTPLGFSTDSQPLIVEIESIPRDTQDSESMARDLLNGDINFLDFHLLQDFVEEHGDEDLKSEMKEYCAMLETFRKATTVKQYIDSEEHAQRNSRRPTPDFTELTVRVVDRAWESAMLEDVEQARIIVAKEMSLSPATLLFITAEEGSVKLKFWLKTKSGRNVQDLFSDLQSMRCTMRNGVVEVHINETFYKATAADAFRLTLEQPRPENRNGGIFAFLCSCFHRAGYREQPSAAVSQQPAESRISSLQERKSEFQKIICDIQSKLDQVIAEENLLAQGEQRSGADYNSTGDHCGGYHYLDDGDTPDIITYLLKVDSNIIQSLGTVLGILPYRLQTTNAGHMVGLWLLQVDNVNRNCHSTGGLTWETLEKAMRHTTVGLTGTADSIKRDKLNV